MQRRRGTDVKSHIRIRSARCWKSKPGVELDRCLFKTRNHPSPISPVPIERESVQLIACPSNCPSMFSRPFSEIFATPAGDELALTMSSKSMKSILQAAFCLLFGAALGIAISPTYKNPHLEWLYASLAIAMGIVTVGFHSSFGSKLWRWRRDGGPASKCGAGKISKRRER